MYYFSKSVVGLKGEQMGHGGEGRERERESQVGFAGAI